MKSHPWKAVLAVIVLVVAIVGGYGIAQAASGNRTASCTSDPTLNTGARSTTFSVTCSVPNQTVTTTATATATQTVTATATATSTVTVTAQPSSKPSDPASSDTPTSQPSDTSAPSSPTPSQSAPASGYPCVPSNDIVAFYPEPGNTTGQGSWGIGNQYDASAEEWGVYPEYRQTMCVYSAAHWTVDATVTNHSGAVQAYPSMRKIYHDWGSSSFAGDPKLSSFPQLKASFAQTDPDCSTCIYDDAFDIWLNGISYNGDTELMIWTHNSHQAPGGNKVASGVSLAGHTWDVYAFTDAPSGETYAAYVPTDVSNISSGTFDLAAFITDASTRTDNVGHLVNADPQVGQVSYGVETVSTGGKPAHWDFSNFAVIDN